MTSPTRTARPAARPQPVLEHTNWAGHPVEVALAAFFWALLLPLLFRATHVPGWISLAGHAAIGAALAAAGWHRKPRPLSAGSILYRLMAVTVFGQWVFWNVADTGGGSRAVLAGFGELVCAAGLVAIGVLGWRARQVKYPAVAAGIWVVVSQLLTAVVAGTIGGGATLVWLGHLMTATQPINRQNVVGWLWPGAVLPAVVLAAVFAILGSVFASREADEDAKRALAMLASTSTREREAMSRLLMELTGEKIIPCIDMQRWDNDGGETYEVDLSQTKLPGWRGLEGYKDTLATRMRLPEGCGVEFAKGGARHLAKILVSRRNRIAESYNYPHELRVSTVYQGLFCGVTRSGAPVSVMLRENGMIVIGQRRAGKTTFLQGLIASMACCKDTLIWVIDFNGGGLALPYLLAWAEGRADRPTIDWVASTIEEARLMAEEALRIALDRKVYYKFRKVAGRVTLLPIDADVPQIMIMLDEGAEAMGEATSDAAREVADSLEKLIRIAGDSGVNVIMSFLRATSDCVNPAVLKNCAVRAGVRVSDKEELAYLFGGTHRNNPDDATVPGSGHISVGHGEPEQVFKGPYMDFESMGNISVATAPWRPYLDARGRELGGRVYRDRWRRARHLLENEHGELRPGILDDDPDRLAPPNQGRPTRNGTATVAAAPTPEGTTMTAERPATTGGPRNADETRTQSRAPRTETGAERLAKNDAFIAHLNALSAPTPVDMSDPQAVRAEAERLFDSLGEHTEPAPPEHPADDGPAVPPPGMTPPPDDDDDAGPVGEPTGPEPAGAEEAIERLLFEHGPLRVADIHRMLQADGRPVSIRWVHMILNRAGYLRERPQGAPYDHVRRGGS